MDTSLMVRVTFVPSAAGRRVDGVSDQAEDVRECPAEDAQNDGRERAREGEDQAVFDQALACSSMTARHDLGLGRRARHRGHLGDQPQLGAIG